MCRKGMHYCHEPLAVLDYYDLVDENGEIPEFAEVEPLDEEHTDDSAKFCTRKLKIKSKISLAGLVKAQISYVRECAEKSGGDWATLTGGNGATLVGGCDSVIVGGHGSIAKGKKGALIVLVARNETGSISSFCAKVVDGVTIKEDVFYKLEDGELKEVGIYVED